MEKIYSKVQPDKLLHMVVRKEEIKSGRMNIVSEEVQIQSPKEARPSKVIRSFIL